MADLTNAELARIYHMLNPGAEYLADPPEKWFRSTLLRQIRILLRDVKPDHDDYQRIVWNQEVSGA